MMQNEREKNAKFEMTDFAQRSRKGEGERCGREQVGKASIGHVARRNLTLNKVYPTSYFTVITSKNLG